MRGKVNTTAKGKSVTGMGKGSYWDRIHTLYFHYFNIL